MATAERTQEVLARLFDVRGARAVVTEAASGLGVAIAQALAECGAHVTLADVESIQSLAGRDLRFNLHGVLSPAGSFITGTALVVDGGAITH